jgi:hypothetical protein
MNPSIQDPKPGTRGTRGGNMRKLVFAVTVAAVFFAPVAEALAMHARLRGVRRSDEGTK